MHDISTCMNGCNKEYLDQAGNQMQQTTKRQ